MTNRWTVVHAVLCMLAGAAAMSLSQPWPLAVCGGASLLVFFTLARPRMTRLLGVGAANAVTLVRLAVLVGAALAAPTWWCFGLVFALDGLDGLLARRLHEETDFGAHFDMETDALLVALLSVASVFGGMPWWVLLFGAMRYLLVIARSLFPSRPVKERRSRFGRHVFSLSVSSLLFSLTAAPELLRLVALAVALVCLSISFAPYFAALRSSNA